MSSESSRSDESSEYGIIVSAPLELIRAAAHKVLFECNAQVVTIEGEEKREIDNLRVGDTVVFSENLDHLPAKVVAVKVGDQQWYVISTTDIPKSGYPTTKDAMKVAASERKKLAIMKDFIAKKTGNLVIDNVESWEPDLRKDAQRIKEIINEASERWTH